MSLKKALLLGVCFAVVAPLTAHTQLIGSVANGIDYTIEKVNFGGFSGAVSFNVTSSRNTWLAFGLGNPDNGDMVSFRTKVIVLADGALSIYGLLSQSQSTPANQPLIQTIYPGNLPVGIHSFSWEKAEGRTTFSFIASSIDGESIVNDGKQFFIAAHGYAGENSFNKKHGTKDRAKISTNIGGISKAPSKAPSLTSSSATPVTQATALPTSSSSSSPVTPGQLPSKTVAPSPSGSAAAAPGFEQSIGEDGGVGEYLFVMIVGGAFLFIVLLFVVLRQHTGNNYFLFLPVVFHVVDIATDLMFALFLMFSAQEKLLASLSIFFIGFPFLLNTLAFSRFSQARMRRDALSLKTARSRHLSHISDRQSDPLCKGPRTTDTTSNDVGELRNDVYPTMIEYRAHHKDAYLLFRFLGSISVQLFTISACRFGNRNAFSAPLSLKEQNKLELQGSVLNLAESLPQAAIVVSLWQWSPFSVCTMFVTCMSILFTVIKVLSVKESMMVSQLLEEVFDTNCNDGDGGDSITRPPAHGIVEVAGSGVGVGFTEDEVQVKRQSTDASVLHPELVEFVSGGPVQFVESSQQSHPQRSSANVAPTNDISITLPAQSISLA